MTTPTFTWAPTGQPNGTLKFRVRTAQFGDGYSQRVADGINNKISSWPLTFVGKKADMQAIAAFLDERAGWQAFNWTPPAGVQGYYQAGEYNLSPIGGDVYTLTVTFQQVFSP
jgi:phage-related protein